MDARHDRRRSPWWPLPAACAALAVALAGRTQIDPWLFGALLLIAWGLLAYGLLFLRLANALRLMLTVTVLALVVVLWSYMAPQPRIHLDTVRVRTLPSTASPGAVEVLVRNSGTLPADVVAYPVAHLGPLFRSAQALSGSRMEAELSGLLDGANRLPPAGALAIPAGQTASVEVEIPPSQQSWYLARGEATVFVTGRLDYRDRGISRERLFCVFATPPSGQWASCPFLND